MVRVLFLHSSNEMYGADKMLLRVIDGLHELAKPIVVLPDDVAADGGLKRELDSRGVEVRMLSVPVLRRAYLTPRGVIGLMKRWFGTWRLLQELDPQVVWCSTSAMLTVSPVAFAQRRRVVLHDQEMWSGLERRALGFLGLSCSSVIAISGAVRDGLPWHMRRRAIIIHNGTPDLGYEPPADGTLVIFVVASRWNAWKGHATLLSAWKAAGEPGRLVIAGGAPPIGEGVDVPAMVDELGLSASVEIVGEQETIEVLLRRAHYMIVPSDQPEPFGLVAIESLAAARPVIASNGGGLAEVIVDGITGHLYEIGSVAELTNALLAASVPESLSMSAHARAAYEERFSLSAFNSSIQQFWRGHIIPTDGGQQP